MLLAHQAQIRRRRHAERFRGSADGKVLVDDDAELALGDLQSRAAQPLPLGAGAAEASLHALNDQAPLKLGDGGDYGENRGAERTFEVDLLPEGHEPTVQGPEQFDRLYD